MDVSTDLIDQEEEIEALASIYGSDFTLLAVDRFELRLHLANAPRPLILRCCIPERYPSTVSPVFELEAEWLIEASENAISVQLGTIAQSNIGQVVIFLWADWIQSSAIELIITLGLFNSVQTDTDVTCDTSRHDSEPSDDFPWENCDPAAGDNVVGPTECAGSDDVVCLMKLDHMRQEGRYCATIRRWADDLGLRGRVYFQGPLILILLHGDADSVRAYIKLHRTQLVDLDRNGRRCKERMLHLAHLGPPDPPDPPAGPPSPAGPPTRRPEPAMAPAANGGGRPEVAGGDGGWRGVARFGEFAVERAASYDALRRELARRGVGPARADAARAFSYARA